MQKREIRKERKKGHTIKSNIKSIGKNYQLYRSAVVLGICLQTYGRFADRILRL